MLKTFRDWLMHVTLPMRIRAWFDFKLIPSYELFWRWIFQVKDDSKHFSNKKIRSRN